MTRPSVFSRRGFALLIVLSLLALLVILLIGLASVTRVETAVAGNTQRQAQARENALLALNLAVAQLQKHAGPDQRVTATADALGGTHKQFTGVWDSAGVTPVTWLVSGNEIFTSTGTTDPLAVTPSTALSITGANPSAIELVGKNTGGTPADVIAPLVPLRADGLPGVAASATIGRYAWWVGDEGVKAAVATGDSTDNVIYAPFDSAELRSRLRQQFALGAVPYDTATLAATFEPQDASNAPLTGNRRVSATPQLAFLKQGLNAAVGLAVVQRNFRAWSPGNSAVLANSKIGGLRQDLSVDPQLLGNAFVAWSDYTGYLEDVASATGSGALPISPAYTSDPVRRRYRIVAPIADGELVHSVTPVLTFFLLNFSIHRASASELEVRARFVAGLTNPYSSALVPEDLVLAIRGLPDVSVEDSNHAVVVVPLQDKYGDPFRVQLSWKAIAGKDDTSSWLPGRTYNWAYVANTAPPNLTQFYERDISQAGSYSRAASGSLVPPLSETVSQPTQLIVELRRASDDALLATYRSPKYERFSTTPSDGTPFNFSFLFRLKESVDSPDDPGQWLSAAGRDPRSLSLPEEAMIVKTDAQEGPFPEQYPNNVVTKAPDRLFDRVQGDSGRSYNEDAPLFELPRAPILSVGVLQHLQVAGARPFAVGNSWADAGGWNSCFDRYFFSGLTSALVPTTNGVGDLLLPNSLLRPIRDGTGAKPTIEALRSVPGARSGKYFLQDGAFNLNSTDAAGWAGVLSGVRFPAPRSFTYLDADTTSGTAADATLAIAAGEAHFFRFSQSAQETYKAEEGMADGAVSSTANTHLFRRGMRTLTAAQVGVLATKISEAIRARIAASGPFRSLEEFLAPSATDSPSVLEQCIADAKINVDANGNAIEFSSQFLTQADIMTALAPVLFARSDTFLVRAYGEAVNPVTGATEGRAWCEATVQRVPEYFDPADPAETLPAKFDEVTDPSDPASAPTLAHQLNKLYGRRFKVVSFRWLTRSDI
jgi:Tfp pilus assembly protein PilX